MAASVALILDLLARIPYPWVSVPLYILALWLFVAFVHVYIAEGRERARREFHLAQHQREHRKAKFEARRAAQQKPKAE